MEETTSRNTFFFFFHHSVPFSGKIQSHVTARLIVKYWVQNFSHLSLLPPICHYSPLLTTACHCLHYSSLFALFVQFARFTIHDYSLFTIWDYRYSLSAIQVFQKPKGHIVSLYVNMIVVRN